MDRLELVLVINEPIHDQKHFPLTDQLAVTLPKNERLADEGVIIRDEKRPHGLARAIDWPLGQLTQRNNNFARNEKPNSAPWRGPVVFGSDNNFKVVIAMLWGPPDAGRAVGQINVGSLTNPEVAVSPDQDQQRGKSENSNGTSEPSIWVTLEPFAPALIFGVPAALFAFGFYIEGGLFGDTWRSVGIGLCVGALLFFYSALFGVWP